MELYSRVSYRVSRQIIFDYSTSFSSSLRLFPIEMQSHIAAVYGLVRIADEVVDTYRGKDALDVLGELEAEVYKAMGRGYSTNPVVHSFVLTASSFSITRALIHPFFISMQMDITPQAYDKKKYIEYIYGSAEVIGLMCLKIFVNGDKGEYERLKKGAQSLGSAYQKVNFLRDIAADFKVLGRTYFPGIDFDTFNDDARDAIIEDIKRDFTDAQPAIEGLPGSSKRAVKLSALYYRSLLDKISLTSADELKRNRVRISNAQKALLFVKVLRVRGKHRE